MGKNDSKWNTDNDIVNEKQQHTDSWFPRSADNSKKTTGDHIHRISDADDSEEIFHNFGCLPAVNKQS